MTATSKLELYLTATGKIGLYLTATCKLRLYVTETDKLGLIVTTKVKLKYYRYIEKQKCFKTVCITQYHVYDLFGVFPIF